MSQVFEQINDLKSQIQPKLKELSGYLCEISHNLPEEVQTYIETLQNTSSNELLEDISQFKVTAATVTILVVGLTTLLILGRVILSSVAVAKEDGNTKKKKKRTSKAQKTNKQIQEVLDNFESSWVPEINDYLLNHKELSSEQVEYKYKYFQEMLLKELLKLDSIDVLGNEIIRENRRKVIQFIQEHQKRLDAFHKELNL